MATVKLIPIGFGTGLTHPGYDSDPVGATWLSEWYRYSSPLPNGSIINSVEVSINAETTGDSSTFTCLIGTGVLLNGTSISHSGSVAAYDFLVTNPSAANWNYTDINNINFYAQIQPDGILYDSTLSNFFATIDYYFAGYTVVIGTSSGIEIEQFTITANITDIGSGTSLQRGFCYIESPSAIPTTADDIIYDSGNYGTGIYSKDITGLTPGRNYRIRPYVISLYGTEYGNTISVRTLSQGGFLFQSYRKRIMLGTPNIR